MLQLIKPITWFPPMWAYLCGVCRRAWLPAGQLAFGGAWAFCWQVPIVCGMSQAANDWCDRHVDAINEPDRPIPSGRIPGRWGLWIALGHVGAGLLVGWLLGPWGFGATVSVCWPPGPIPLRADPPEAVGLVGPRAWSGLSYETLPWFTGAAVLAPARRSRRDRWSVLYGLGAHGIMTLNDFKALEGDRQMGVNSLPVTLAPTARRRWPVWVMALPQVVVIALLPELGPPAACGSAWPRFWRPAILGHDGDVPRPQGQGALVQRHRRVASMSRA